jgi:hypothetical protein
VEIAWPWSGLKELTPRCAPPCDGDQWRINFSRVEWDHEIVGGAYRKIKDRREHNWVWSPQGVIDMHRPERWGYLQFSTAKPGTAVFAPDPAGPVIDVLHRIYYAQKAYKEKYGRWARTLKQLGLDKLRHPAVIGRLRLETTSSLFEAQAEMRGPDGKPLRWHIRSDSRVWSD